MPSPVLGNARPAAAGPKATQNKPIVNVSIDGHYASKVYTSGSKITGQVDILSLHDLKYDEFEIALMGVSSTRLDFVQQFNNHSWRPFMKLTMPLDEGVLPPCKTFKAGQRYQVAFNFVVPYQLTIGACNHPVEDACVQHHHLRMPPSVGCWEADDMAPEMARVQYMVKAHANRRIAGADKKKTQLVLEGEHVVKCLPARPEEPPMDIGIKDERYKLSTSKTFRKTMFSPKTGKVMADTAQPGAVMLSPDGRVVKSSLARINLQYVPDTPESSPPKVTSYSVKLHTSTYFSGGAVDHLPNMGLRSEYHATPALSYSNNINLVNNQACDPVSWKQENVSRRRRDSGYSSLGEDEESDSPPTPPTRPGFVRRISGDKTAKKAVTPSPIRHTTSVDIPFTLPSGNKKIFLPSFHNCLISRTYSLHITLNVGTNPVNLVLPLQIGVETVNEFRDEALPTFEDAMALAEIEDADSYFAPRDQGARINEMLSHNNVLPGYEQSLRTVAVI